VDLESCLVRSATSGNLVVVDLGEEGVGVGKERPRELGLQQLLLERENERPCLKRYWGYR
jgi:hypothetical protein